MSQTFTNQAQAVNPLLVTSDHRHEAVAFDLIRTEHFVPALQAQIAKSKILLQELKANPQSPTFENTILALEAATSGVYDVLAIYSNLKSAYGDSEMRALAKEIMPLAIALEGDINLDAAIFARVKAVFLAEAAGDHKTPFTAERRTLITKTYRGFRRNGAELSEADKNKLRAIDAELAILGPSFSDNVLKATNAFTLVITDPTELDGLPASAIEAAALTAIEKGVAKKAGDAWVFTLHGPSQMAFLKYATNRERRRQLWLALSSRALQGENSNKPVLLRLAALRHQRARLLGYQSHAHFQLEERMAENPERVRGFLETLCQQSRPAAERELAELKMYKLAQSGDGDLQPWDYAFWANKLKEEQFKFNAEDLRPYFKLESVLAGAFEHANRLYDLSFAEIHDLPVYQPDVKVYEVKTLQGEFLGLFYVDFFPSDRKGGGAWATRYKSQFRRVDQDGRIFDHRPHVAIVCNFTKPMPSKPALLTFLEVNTLFHEFGHALHSLLSRCQYRSLSCTNVYRDFVELPSQIMENWIREEEGLALFARHEETGAPISHELVAKIKASESFHSAIAMLRQLRFAMLDLAWHSAEPGKSTDVEAFEAEAVKATTLFPEIPGTNISCAFEHIFSGGYSAGYYGYKWAEVLDADAFELFKELGIFSRVAADRFRVNILEKGGSEPPSELYRRFRGREPDPQALLRRSHLL